MPYSVSPHWNFASLQPADVEADVELLALHAAHLGDEEVPQLVHEDHEAQARRRPAGSSSQFGWLISHISDRQTAHQAHTHRATSWRAQRSSSNRSLERGIGFKCVMLEHAPAGRHDLGKV